jgi:molybdate transport system substrate-binding protein
MRALTVVVAMCLAVAACGGNGASDTPALTVSAATSLKQAFSRYGEQFSAAHARFSFAGSDELAAQIQQGVKPDVFASANTKLPAQLFAKGLVRKPTVFAANRLVLAVPAEGAKVSSLDDVAKRGVTVAMGSPSVPVGSYTRKVLGGLPAAERARIQGNVRSEEPDVGGVIGKVSQGAVDAGFVYITDVKASDGAVRAIALPPRLQPRVAYAVAVVKGAPHPQQAKAFIAGLLHGAGRAELQRAGFEPPPSS